MEGKSSKQYSVAFLVEGDKFKLRNLPSRTSSLLQLMQLQKESLKKSGRGQGSNPGKPDFFRLSFRNCIRCVNNCEDLLYMYFFNPQFKYMNFIHS